MVEGLAQAVADATGRCGPLSRISEAELLQVDS
jgi:hypothetical protein